MDGYTFSEYAKNAKALYDSYMHGDDPCFGNIPRENVLVLCKDFATYAPYIPLHLTPIKNLKGDKDMSYKNSIYRISLNYNRTGKVWITTSHCSVCNIQSLCLAIDGSEEEYGEIYLCKHCIDKLFKENFI
jgi:hypothetical protein